MASPGVKPALQTLSKDATSAIDDDDISQDNTGEPLRPILTNSPDSWSASSASDEDYDKIQPNLNDIVEDAHGGGIEESRKVSNGTALSVKSHSIGGPVTFQSIKPPGERPKHLRGKSFQFTIGPKDENGQYEITEEDREVLRDILEGAAFPADASKKRRLRFRDLMFTKRLTTFDRHNPLAAESPFHGFFTMMWLCMAMLLIRIAAWNWRDHGSVFGGAELLHMMFDRDVILLGVTDGIMCAATVFGLVLQKIIKKGYISWDRSGWIIQNAWQTFYLGACIGWTFYRQWPWTHTIFITLHSLVFLMKQHSYSFYNGYLSQVHRRKVLLEQKLSQLDDIVPTPSSPEAKPNRAFTSSAAFDVPPTAGKLNRRGSIGPKASTNLLKEKSEISTIATSIESGEPLDNDQLRLFSMLLRNEIAAVDDELSARCSDKAHAYPNNLTLSNFADWTVLPTLVYELEYPRQDHRNWWYIAEKTLATFGCIWVMMVISQAYIYPPVKETVRMKEAGMTLQQRWVEFPWILSDLLFPILLEQLLSWYVIWECVLNVLAELTLFADRGFYGDWWNSVSWDQYARDWNRPVHNFLLRHVYHSSISAFHFSKATAMFATFFLSACVHELVMFCLFKKVRGYLFFFQLLQIPLAAMSRTKLLKGRTVAGNIIFWIGLFVGPSLITSLYLIV